MPNEPDPKFSLEQITQVISACSEAAKATVGAESEESARKSERTRGGPLQSIGRLYAILATLAAVSSGVGSYIDHTATSDNIHWSTVVLRFAFLVVVLTGTFGGAFVIWVLLKKHPYLLSSPTEVSSSTHAALIEGASAKATPSGEKPPKALT